MKTELIKPIIRVGNSAGVILPKEWLNGTAKIELVEKPLNILKDVLEILSPYLQNILGIYLVGSYARGEQEQDSDVDIIAFSNNISKEILSRGYHISIYPLSKVEKTLKQDAMLILPRILEAKPILNKPLLEEIHSKKVSKNSFKKFLESSKRIYKINKDLFEIDNRLDKHNIYSLILRLRGFFILENIFRKKLFLKKEFNSWLSSNGLDSEKLYRIYSKVKSDKKVKINLKKAEGEKLLNLLKQNIIKWEKEIKE